MKKIFLGCLLSLFLIGIAFAQVDFTGWKVAIRQVSKSDNKVILVVDIITPQGRTFGREISWAYDEVSILTLAQFRDKVKAQARYIIEQEYEDYLLRNKVSSILNVEVSVE